MTPLSPLFPSAFNWNKHRLISLYELLVAMQNVNAGWFGKVVRGLDDVRSLCQMFLQSEKAAPRAAPIEVQNTIRTHVVESYRTALTGIKDTAEHFDLAGTRILVDRFSAWLKDSNYEIPVHEVQATYDRAGELRDRFIDELKTRTALILPTDKLQYYAMSASALFGDVVADKFPSATFDISEAGKCFALGRHTASVFHLMRCLEIGLGVLARRFDVSTEHAQWQVIINEIDSKVRNMGSNPNKTPGWRGEQEYYAQVTSDFTIYKMAYRNCTAHPRARFDEEEAENLLKSVKIFMGRLSERFGE